MSKQAEPTVFGTRTLYRACRDHVAKCTGTSYPDSDSDGEKIYDNTHFEDEGEAWESVIANCAAYVKLAGQRIVDAKLRLQMAQESAGEAAESFVIVQDRFHDWQREQEARGTTP